MIITHDTTDKITTRSGHHSNSCSSMTYSFRLHHVIGTDNFPALIEFARDKNGMQFIEAVDASHNNWYPDTHSLRN